MNLSDPETNLRAFIKTRASLDGTDTVNWFAGMVHAMTPGANQPLLAFEGYNISRAVEVEGGYDFLTREAVFYQDPTSREIVDTWTNPFTDQTVDVIHIWNDPVNMRFRTGRMLVPHTQIGEEIVFNIDVFLAYPSPLPRADFPDNSQADTYQAAELFQFFVAKASLEDSSPSAPALISWTRIAPWLPFMRMADAPGHLVYHCRGAKLLGGYAELPEKIRARVEADGPQYKTAPTEFTEPNETSWTYYRKLVARSPA